MGPDSWMVKYRLNIMFGLGLLLLFGPIVGAIIVAVCKP